MWIHFTRMNIAGGLALLASSLAAQAQLASGPATWSANQTWAVDTVNGGNLTGYFYWPASPPRLAGKRALVLVLHGCTQTAAGDVIEKTADKGFNWKAMADQYGAVILAPNATGNVYSNHCWDYASSNHNRSAGHDAILLDLVQRFRDDPQYAIDPNQVYVAGLSSGGGETVALGCMAPEIFAGVGINAGPPPGTTTAQIGFVPSGYTAATAAHHCAALAGNNAPSFTSQISSVIWGSADFTVAQGYGPIDAAAMRATYGGTFSQGATTTVATGGSNIPYTDGKGKLRTSEITVSGMAHAWPAGAGGQNSHFVDATKVNYPAFLMDFWFNNNLRVSTIAAPVMTACHASASGNIATVDGAASDAAGTVSAYAVQLNGPTTVFDPNAGSATSFSKQYAQLGNGYYTGTVTATDAGTGQSSAPCKLAQLLIGPAPVIQAPTGLALDASTATTISLSWKAADGAKGYKLYRNQAGATVVTATSYTDTGLAPSTSYSYRVSAFDANAVESAPSAAVSASTTAAWTCSTVKASNYAHVHGGRAYDSGGKAYATGSKQSMGLDNLFFMSTLAQTAPGYYIVGACP
ncbi:poly(3-hydroxybutyrate) depolymerase [Oxalobacteraceae bacterium GrIS 1.11]